MEEKESEVGEELCARRSNEIRSWQTQLEISQDERKALQKRTARLEENHAAEITIKNAEIEQVEKEVAFREKHLATCREFLTRNQKLAAEKLVSEVELIQYELQ